MKQIPMASADLIDQLVKDEPTLDITPKLTMEEIQFKSGRWSILNELRIRQEYYKNNNPNRNTVEIKDVHE